MSEADVDNVVARPDSLIGKRTTRANAKRLLAGQGRFVDDIKLPRMAHVAFYRSPHAHARLVSIDTTAAAKSSGVLRIFTGRELADVCKPWVGVLTHMKGLKSAPQYPLVLDRACWQGEPVVAVVASSRAEAEDAIELLAVDWQELEVVADPETALDPTTPVLHPELGDNLAFEGNHDKGDVDGAFDRAAVTVERTFRFGRHTGVTPEPRGLIADFRRTERRLTVYHSHQAPSMVQDIFARHLGLPSHHVRIVCGDVGGAYGIKGHLYPDEIATAAIAMLMQRPVKFIADRLEAFVSDIHTRDHRVCARMAFAADGELLAIDMDDLAGVGPYSMYPRTSALEAIQVLNYTGGPYLHQNYRARARVVFQNKMMMSQYRAVGHPVATAVAECLMEDAARKLGMDPVAIRRRNLIPDDAYPCQGITGIRFEGLSHHASLDKLLSLFDYTQFRREQADLRGKGVFRGIGFSCLVELTNPGAATYGQGGARITSQYGAVTRLDPDGNLIVQTSLTEQGQGSETVIAQVTASAFGISPDRVQVISGDTDNTPAGWGAGGSGGAGIGGEAALQAGKTLRRNVLKVAGTLLQTAPDALDIRNGEVVDRATGTVRLPIEEVARVAYFRPDTLPVDFRAELIATHYYVPRQYPVAFTNSFHAAAVEVDVETGFIQLLNYWGVEDCGRVINKLLAEEQMRGSIVQGLGGVLYEECIYGADGQLRNGNMADYLVPMAGELPDFVVGHVETATRESELGAKGAGEAGTAGAPAAVMNAVNDAIAPFGASISQTPITPARLLKALGRY